MQTVLLPKCNNFLTIYFSNFRIRQNFENDFVKNIWNEPQSKKFTLNFENVTFRKYKL